ncbi:hypothetical protein CROQUDRAFT_89764 [Cronartium quercuum f. sp. fusiforme G11]|uniref:Uncharacterized protein n=1 Tax=Cronartium quercuum f. sp. fusiforme G11 TaxID=708437 RepID=A0A9P6TE24_9BASI|nr:hypothetical protein CROQUDRAFT_89764 [Cronartium quercuum f. sp. fusiforme G11]
MKLLGPDYKKASRDWEDLEIDRVLGQKSRQLSRRQKRIDIAHKCFAESELVTPQREGVRLKFPLFVARRVRFSSEQIVCTVCAIGRRTKTFLWSGSPSFRRKGPSPDSDRCGFERETLISLECSNSLRMSTFPHGLFQLRTHLIKLPFSGTVLNFARVDRRIF